MFFIVQVVLALTLQAILNLKIVKTVQKQLNLRMK